MSVRLIAAAAALSLAAPAAAQEHGSTQTRNFVQAAAQSDQFELLEARVALTQSRDPQVRQFASMMIDAHQATSAALNDAVTRAGLKSPDPGLSGDQAMLLGALQSQNGADFDKTYARHQTVAHRGALAIEQKYAANGDEPSVRKAATSAVPTISQHLAMAERMAAGVGGQ